MKDVCLSMCVCVSVSSQWLTKSIVSKGLQIWIKIDEDRCECIQNIYLFIY